jgi:tetratricopeptide (TPR) repeat protein
MIASACDVQIALIVLAAALSFGASLQNEFVYDDYAIFSDAILQSPTGWWEVWLTHTRPLTYFTFWTRFTPPVQHALNLALHLVAVWLAFDVLSRLVPRSAAVIATLLFAIHPLQGEAVNYVWARSTLLMTVFCLLSWRGWLGEHRWRAVLWFGLALLAKEECVAFPFILALTNRDWKPLGAMFALALAAGARVYWIASLTPGSQAGLQAPYSAPEYFWTQGIVILRYLRLLVMPVGLTPDPAIAPGLYWWGWLLIAVACAFAYKQSVWFVAGIALLLPSSSIFPASELAADRRMYLPMLAFAMVIGVALQRWWKPAIITLALALVPLSMARARVWQSDETLWSDALRKNPNSVRARLLLARGGTKPEVIEMLERAKELAPDNAEVASQLGRVYLNSGGPERALPEFGRALALMPNSPEALSNRGVALLLLKQTDAARQDFERALKIEPCFWDARYNLKRMGVDTAIPANCRYTPVQRQMLEEIR